MKDINISAKRQKKELWIFILCFVAAFVLNMVAIILYNTNWTELFTHLGYVVTIAVVLYILFALLRGVIQVIRFLFHKGSKISL